MRSWDEVVSNVGCEDDPCEVGFGLISAAVCGFGAGMLLAAGLVGFLIVFGVGG